MPQPKHGPRAATHSFVGVIYKVGILRCVSVPEEICARLARSHARTVPVVATVAGQTLRTTLLPAAGGSYRLFLNRAMRKAAGADTGEPVGVTLQTDRESREMVVPEDVRAALGGAQEARRYFLEKSTSLRREVLRYIDQAKAAETRARRIGKCVRELTRRARKKRRVKR